MYDIKIEYIVGKPENFRCEDYYFNDIDTMITLEMSEKHKVIIMIHQLRKLDILETEK